MQKSWKFEDLSIVILLEEGTWVAQCLEFDVAAQGTSLDAVLASWQRAFVNQAAANIELGKDPMQDVPRAPSHYFEKFREARPLGGAVDLLGPTVAPDVPPPWIIHATASKLRLSA
jgi:hypothetical protein